MPAARALNVLILPFLVAVLVAACANSSAPTAPSAAPETATPSTPVPGSEAPDPEPATEAPATSEPPVSEAPSPSLEPEPTDDNGGPVAGQCTGTDENLAFYAQFAQVVDWPVYCPVLPSGWFVGTGQWRQVDGPRLEISYRGPDGAGLLLQEGAYCLGGDDCVPPGDELGTTAFGDREGTLVATADGWAIVVDPGDQPSWLLTVTGVSETAARRIAGDLVQVDS
jgi:hypothetical protein